MLLGSAGDNSVGSGKYGYPGFRGLDSCGLRLNHDRDAFADMSCRHKNRNTYCDKWQQKVCSKVMKKEQVVDQKLSQLADFPLLCAHSGKF
jgi:hypothetical protein